MRPGGYPTPPRQWMRKSTERNSLTSNKPPAENGVPRSVSRIVGLVRGVDASAGCIGIRRGLSAPLANGNQIATDVRDVRYVR